MVATNRVLPKEFSRALYVRAMAVFIFLQSCGQGGCGAGTRVSGCNI